MLPLSTLSIFVFITPPPPPTAKALSQHPSRTPASNPSSSAAAPQPPPLRALGRSQTLPHVQEKTRRSSDGVYRKEEEEDFDATCDDGYDKKQDEEVKEKKRTKSDAFDADEEEDPLGGDGMEVRAQILAVGIHLFFCSSSLLLLFATYHDNDQPDQLS